MSEPEALPAGIHPEIALLPWYVNGTLPMPERQQLARHLETCESCRIELQELTELKRDLTTAYEAQPAPRSHLAQTVMATVAAERGPRQEHPRMKVSWLSALDHWLRSLFFPRWVPTLAALLLVVQMGLLLWVGLPPDELEEVSTRSVSTQTARFTVSLESSATAEQIQAVLQSVHGHVIDGPSVGGLYTIEAPSSDVSTREHILSVLKRRTDVVRSAEPLRP